MDVDRRRLGRSTKVISNDDMRLAEFRRWNIRSYMRNNPPEWVSRTTCEYVPPQPRQNRLVVSFAGRGATPWSIEEGMNQAAAHAAQHGCRALLCPAYDRSRRTALMWLQQYVTPRTDPLDTDRTHIVLLGTSHGGDHAIQLAREFVEAAEHPVDVLCTIDAVNSPTPLPLQLAARPSGVRNHVNYYQRRWLWLGGNLKESADPWENYNVTNWPSWIRLCDIRGGWLKGITHVSIAEDLFLAGEITRFW